MSNNLTVRPVVLADFDQWLPLWNGYNAYYGRSGSTARDRTVTNITCARFFDGYEAVHALVAEGRLVDVDRAIAFDSPGDFHRRSFCGR